MGESCTGPGELIAYNEYDDLGQLVQKKVGGAPGTTYALTDGLQTVDYAYNIRGWLKSINQDQDNTDNDLFDFGISYNDPQHGGVPQYTHNVAETEWKTANDNVTRWYSYGYDALYRLENAVSHNGNYDVSLSYDKMGNIQSLARNGWQNGSPYADMDVLDYDYDNGNKLLRVTDTGNTGYGFKDGNTSGDDYEYDGNLNMTVDRNKGITSITYNHLNMPTNITVVGSNAGTLDYVYAADGTKLRKSNSNGTITDYDGNYVYENGNLKQITQPEGYIEPDGMGGYDYVYRYTDMWGNTRLTYADDNNDGSINPATEIRREQNYYPWGLEHKGYNEALYGSKNDLRTYQSQEFTDDLGLDFHEWRYRASYPDIVRFWQVDPLAEDYAYNSTFAFQENKFGIGIELEGLEVARFKDGMKQVGSGVNRAYREATNVRREMNIQGANGSRASEMAQQERISQYSTAAGDVAQGTTEATKGGAKVIGEGMEMTGDAITVAGIATAQPEIIALGEGISTTGSVINGLVDLSDGKSPIVVGAEFGASIAFGELGDQAVKGSRIVAGSEFVESGANKVSESILQGINKGFETITKELIIPAVSTPPATPPATPQLDSRLIKDENNPLFN